MSDRSSLYRQNIRPLSVRAFHSALAWLVDRYQVKTDKASGIVNDPNDWATEHGNPRYILDLVKRIVTVSLETIRIVRNFPPLDEAL